MPNRSVRVASSPQLGSTPIADPASDARWRALFGTEPPRSASLMAQAIAWREQVATAGDVSAAVRRDLALAAAEARKARGHGAGVEQPPGDQLLTDASAPMPSPTLPPASSRLVPGTRLVKSYGGRTHVVEVTEGGMLYERQLYASLASTKRIRPRRSRRRIAAISHRHSGQLPS